MLAGDGIRILAVFSSGKVMAKWINSRVISSHYTCYENHQSSCRVGSIPLDLVPSHWCKMIATGSTGKVLRRAGPSCQTQPVIYRSVSRHSC